MASLVATTRTYPRDIDDDLKIHYIVLHTLRPGD